MSRESLFADGPSDYERRDQPWTAFCQGGSATCETCVGSCGIEEYEERESDPPPKPRPSAVAE